MALTIDIASNGRETERDRQTSILEVLATIASREPFVDVYYCALLVDLLFLLPLILFLALVGLASCSHSSSPVVCQKLRLIDLDQHTHCQIHLIRPLHSHPAARHHITSPTHSLTHSQPSADNTSPGTHTGHSFPKALHSLPFWKSLHILTTAYRWTAVFCHPCHAYFSPFSPHLAITYKPTYHPTTPSPEWHHE